MNTNNTHLMQSVGAGTSREKTHLYLFRVLFWLKKKSISVSSLESKKKKVHEVKFDVAAPHIHV